MTNHHVSYELSFLVSYFISATKQSVAIARFLPIEYQIKMVIGERMKKHLKVLGYLPINKRIPPEYEKYLYAFKMVLYLLLTRCTTFNRLHFFPRRIIFLRQSLNTVPSNIYVICFAKTKDNTSNR